MDFDSAVNDEREDRIEGMEWQIIRERVYFRDNCCCKSCGRKIKYSYVTDHIIPLALGGSNDDSNLQTLCIGCDKIKTKDDRVKISRVQKFKRCRGNI